jgi:hypothetical protein
VPASRPIKRAVVCKLEIDQALLHKKMARQRPSGAYGLIRF